MYDISHKYPFLAGAFHLAYYVPRNTGHSDQISEDLLSFKNGVPNKVRFWCNKAIQEIGNTFNPSFIVRALGSSELTIIQPSPLDQLGQSLAQHLNTTYQPGLLTKSSSNPPLKGLNKAGRENAISGLYAVANVPTVGNPEILVLDDIITTGSTIKEISRALKQAYPTASVQFLALAKTKGDYSEIAQSRIEKPSQSDRPVTRSFNQYDELRAYKMGMSPESMMNMRGKYRNFGKSWGRSDIREMVKLASEGNTISTIASALGRTPKSIRIKLNQVAFGRDGSNLSFIGDDQTVRESLQEYWREQLKRGVDRFRVPTKADSGCFIATAVYSSIEHPIVIEFRHFRDEILTSNSFGRKFISIYYRYSPLAVPFIKRSRALRALIHFGVLLPLFTTIRKLNSK
jgi:hypothetical protein